MNPSSKVPPLRSPSGNQIRLDGTFDPVDRPRVAITEKGKNANPYEIVWTHRDRMHDRVPCSNPNCFDGGFLLGDLLRELVSARQQDYIGTSFCKGRTGDPEAKGPHPSCDTRYDVQIHLTFH